jgi:hypothetical protein
MQDPTDKHFGDVCTLGKYEDNNNNNNVGGPPLLKSLLCLSIYNNSALESI